MRIPKHPYCEGLPRYTRLSHQRNGDPSHYFNLYHVSEIKTCIYTRRHIHNCMDCHAFDYAFLDRWSYFRRYILHNHKRPLNA